MFAKNDSDMEGWEDDGWGTFDSTPQEVAPPKSSQQQQQQLGSGADFFDSFGASGSTRTEATKARDPFEEFGLSTSAQGRAGKKDRTPPPLTSASLFGGSTSSKKPAATESNMRVSNMHVSVAPEVETGGWGDWDENFGTEPAPKVCVLRNIICTENEDRLFISGYGGGECWWHEARCAASNSNL